jgi:ssDNA-binding Zn-finger/Zn-ribbon topoisomerase 1
MAKVPCPNCGAKLSIREEHAGQQTRCPKCKVLLQLDADSRRGFSLRRLLSALRRRKPTLVVVGA